ncbi:MAG: hypothetical protein WC120_05320 [Parcubacteria group bacterium]|jgi:hypothetical protein
MDAKHALDTVCHTSERTHHGTVYTLGDLRFPDLQGRQIVATLEHGTTVYRWNDKGE